VTGTYSQPIGVTHDVKCFKNRLIVLCIIQIRKAMFSKAKALLISVVLILGATAEENAE
jgi:hypothetical protein